MKEYKIGPYKRGVHDLKSLFAFHGNSQGDDSQHNDIQRYKDSMGWNSFCFACGLTEEEIAKEIETRRAWNEAYVARLREEGRYEEEYFITVRIKHNPIFDSPQNPVT